MRLSEIILLEHVVNLLTPEQKREYIDVVWDILQKAYAPVGGFKSVSSKEELIDDSSIWKLVRRADKIVSVVIYKNKAGRKIIGLATDATEQGKADLIKTIADDLKLCRAWAEVSDKPEKMMSRLGGVPISNKLAGKLTGKEILGYDLDGVHYTRLIAGEPHRKIIYGFPEMSAEDLQLARSSKISIKDVK